jgi:hypothetical protein
VTQVSAQLAEPGADTDALMAKMDRLQTAIDACNGWELDRQVQRATDALRCPPGDHPGLICLQLLDHLTVCALPLLQHLVSETGAKEIDQ